MSSGPEPEATHRLVNPDSLPAPAGFSHAVVAERGRHVFVAGQVAAGADGEVADRPIDEQFDLAAGHVVRCLESSGARPQHMVSLLIYVTDVRRYRAMSREIGRAYRRHFGPHYPAMALLGVTELADRHAKVELVATAVVPDADDGADSPEAAGRDEE